MITPESDEFSVELLAAYADGELDDSARAAVERWLAAHPEAMDDLRTQRELAANAPLWDAVEPPEPSSGTWAVLHQTIENRLTSPGADATTSAAPSNRRRWRAAAWVLAGLTSAGVAATVGWLAFGPTAPTPPLEGNRNPREVVLAPQPTPSGPEQAPAPRPVTSNVLQPSDPLGGFAVLPMPTDDDVVLDRVPALRTGSLPVGRHPVPGLLVLAAEDEVQLEDVEPSPIWPTGGPRMTTAPGDAPMIFAAKPR